MGIGVCWRLHVGHPLLHILAIIFLLYSSVHFIFVSDALVLLATYQIFIWLDKVLSLGNVATGELFA